VGQGLRLQIIQAIRNRAITGVEVSVIDQTAYLDGHVETETQKFAAERAARDVPGVEYVRNRIVAKSLLAPKEKEDEDAAGS
jgi:osmotically-inducible protein OsmY